MAVPSPAGSGPPVAGAANTPVPGTPGGQVINAVAAAARSNQRVPCPAWQPGSDIESETYEHWRRRFNLWLRGELENGSPYQMMVREFIQAMTGPALDHLTEMMSDEDFYRRAVPAVAEVQADPDFGIVRGAVWSKHWKSSTNNTA